MRAVQVRPRLALDLSRHESTPRGRGTVGGVSLVSHEGVRLTIQISNWSTSRRTPPGPFRSTPTPPPGQESSWGCQGAGPGPGT